MPVPGNVYSVLLTQTHIQCATKHITEFAMALLLLFAVAIAPKQNSRYDNPIQSHKIVLIYNVFAFIYSGNSKLKKHSLNSNLLNFVFSLHTFYEFRKRILGWPSYFQFSLIFLSFASESVLPFSICTYFKSSAFSIPKLIFKQTKR